MNTKIPMALLIVAIVNNMIIVYILYKKGFRKRPIGKLWGKDLRNFMIICSDEGKYYIFLLIMFISFGGFLGFIASHFL